MATLDGLDPGQHLWRVSYVLGQRFIDHVVVLKVLRDRVRCQDFESGSRSTLHLYTLHTFSYTRTEAIDAAIRHHESLIEQLAGWQREIRALDKMKKGSLSL